MRRFAIPLIVAIAAFAVPSGASAALTGGERDDVFLITGDGADDRVVAVANGTRVSFDFGADGTEDRSVAMADITDVVVELGPGTDSFSATGNLAVVPRWSVNGGAGPDRLLGTNGVDALTGGSGDDFIDGQQGNDTTAGGTGADTIQWDPGDGSETLDGGGDADLDTLSFNGSNGAEIYTVTDTDTGFMLTRNLGNIVMTVSRVDRLDLKTLGAVDNITATGTAGVTQLDIDAGADADTITTGNGGDRIFGGTEADTIDAGAGDDRIFAGAGPDQAFGREGDDGIEGGEGLDNVNGGANTDGCTDAGDIVNECESSTLPADVERQPFPHPLEPEETPVDPDPQDPDPEPTDPDGEQPAPVAGFAIDGVRADRRGLRVEVSGTAAEAVEVEVGATETVKRAGRSGKRKVTYATVTRVVPAGEAVTVRLKAPRRHRGTISRASRRKVSATVTNVTNGLSATEEIRSNR